MPSERGIPLSIRLIGIVLLLVGTGQWLADGWWFDLPIGKASIEVPLHIGLIVVGFAFAVLPLIALYIAYILIPVPALKNRILTTIDRLEKEDPPSTDTLTPSDLLNFFTRKYRSLNLRYHVTIAALLIASGLVLAIYIPETLKRRDHANYFSEATTRLIALVQEVRLDFSSADLVRQSLRAIETNLPLATTNTSTERLQGLLTDMYSADIIDLESFHAKQEAIYQKEIFPHVNASTKLLEGTALLVPYDSDLEPITAKATLLTLLAMLAIHEGGDGSAVGPYLQARQFLDEALGLGLENYQFQLPSTFNALGLAHAEILKNYSNYEAHFTRTDAIQKAFASELHESAPLTPVTLAQIALANYERAEVSGSNFIRARALNNRVDLGLSLIQQVHIEGLTFAADGASEVRFLSDNADPPPSDANSTWIPSRLPHILQEHQLRLDRATTLAREPRIYFTKAQLLSITGQLYQKYPDAWSSSVLTTDGLREEAVRNLETSYDLGIEVALFDRERATQLMIDWLWTAPNLIPRLEALRQPRESQHAED